MNLKRAYSIGFDLGLGMADTLDEIAAWKLDMEQDDSPMTLDDVVNYVAGGFDGYIQFSPWEDTANEFNASRNPDATWAAFHRGMDAGARQAHMWALSSTKYKRPDNIVVPVKNLGWIIKHRLEVRRVIVDGKPNGKASFTACLVDGTLFESDFADITLAQRFSSSRRFPLASRFEYNTEV